MIENWKKKRCKDGETLFAENKVHEEKRKKKSRRINRTFYFIHILVDRQWERFIYKSNVLRTEKIHFHVLKNFSLFLFFFTSIYIYFLLLTVSTFCQSFLFWGFAFCISLSIQVLDLQRIRRRGSHPFWSFGYLMNRRRQQQQHRWISLKQVDAQHIIIDSVYKRFA